MGKVLLQAVASADQEQLRRTGDVGYFETFLSRLDHRDEFVDVFGSLSYFGCHDYVRLLISYSLGVVGEVESIVSLHHLRIGISEAVLGLGVGLNSGWSYAGRWRKGAAY